MIKFGNLLILVTTHFCIVYASNNETTITNSTHIGKEESIVVAPGVTISKIVPPIGISEKTLTELQNVEAAKLQANNAKSLNSENTASQQQKEASILIPGKAEVKNISTAESSLDENSLKYQQALQSIDVDIESSVRTGFYILMGLSVGALLFVGFKINKLRLTRAERKYGVQGDRTNQELAPLPISIEDSYSDDEDQTVFDINREQMRIF